MTACFNVVQGFSTKNGLKLNNSKSGLIVLDIRTKNEIGDRTNYTGIPIVRSYIHLGIHVNRNSSIKIHLKQIKPRAICIMRSIRPYIANIKSSTILSLYKMLMKPHFDYCRPLAVELGDKATEELNAAERQAFKMMFSIGRSVKNEW